MDPMRMQLETELPQWPPFWRNTTAILRYPLQPPALTTICACAVFAAVGILPWVGIVLLLLLWAVVFRYAVEVLQRTANGYSIAPELAPDSANGDGHRMLLLQLLFVFAIAAVSWIGNPGIRIASFVALALVQPAATLTLALTGNLVTTLNPLRWLRIALRLGAPYLALVVAPLLLGLLQDHANAWIAGVLPSIVAMMLSGWIAFYLLVLEFHLIGYLIYQYRDRLDWSPQWQPPLHPGDRHAEFMHHIERLVADDEIAEAVAQFEPYLRGAMHATPAMHARYRSLLGEIGNTQALLQHGNQRISQLLAEADHRQALALLRELLALDPEWRPAAADHCIELSDAAERVGQSQTALLLLREFHLRHPKHPNAPELAMRAAQLLLDREGNTDAARALLRDVADRYPQHPLQDELQSRLAALDALSAKLARHD